MPKLSQIELYLDGDYSKEEKREFLFKSRSVCNFWEREISKLMFTSNYSRLNVYVSDGSKEEKVQPMKAVPFLEVIVHYPIKQISKVEDIELQRHFIKILGIALNATGSVMPIPFEQSMDILRRFEENNYKNEWVQAAGVWEKKSIESKVTADLSFSEFKLTQYVYESSELVGESVILNTLPREILFNEYLGKLSLSKCGILEYKKGKNVLSQFDIKSRRFS